MTGADIKILNTAIRAGREMDDTTFYTLANLSRLVFESKRPWRKLLTFFNTNTSDSSDTVLTAKSLPNDFLMCSNKNALTLVNGENRLFYTEIPIEDLDSRRHEPNLFAVDIASGNYYLSGVVPSGTWTHQMWYAKRSPLITATVGWVFPDDYAPYIAFEVAVMDQLGIDYDDTNARQGSPNASRADMVLQSAIKWDDTLQRNALRGVENTYQSNDWRNR